MHMQTIEMNELQTPEVAALEARQRFMDQSLFTVYARSHENEPLKVLPLDQSDQKVRSIFFLINKYLFFYLDRWLPFCSRVRRTRRDWLPRSKISRVVTNLFRETAFF